ncbi:hypothetical protein C5167_027057 [Papaver somniferum]|uniref:probable mitochondrial adenine nucleotide transporter BTL3 n=1 Tax=Papaver somniferum TaxID=3469 RepID=UPI000E7026D8|nr:probable mitochondrial adenine nucleotide transporter BTL3 [Papaver somniferum]RZC89515.1 hypothetical protein C5167_027057 [Papaver somniferum]
MLRFRIDSFENPAAAGVGGGAGGGLFLESTVPISFVSFISSRIDCSNPCLCSSSYSNRVLKKLASNSSNGFFERKERGINGFLSVSLSSSGNSEYVEESSNSLLKRENGEKMMNVKGESVEKSQKQKQQNRIRSRQKGAMNTTKHLWSGAIAAMVSRTFVAPLERLKLEYILRGEKKNLFELIKTIAANQGLRGFWKGNFVNILRTAPFKAINFYAYDTYRKNLLKMSGNESTTNVERFLAGASAGITATILCLPLDTIRTKLVAPGGESLGGVVGAFRHMLQTEGFFSLYKGLLPSILSMAPAGAVFYGVYDILKSAYLHSPEGRNRTKYMNQQGQELNAFDQLELGPFRTLLYGAISGACAEAATYPFEVVRRQLQMQVKATRLSPLATCAKIVERGGVPALYAGLIPSLLQVLPSAGISYFVYEFMKIIFKVE